ncbi:salt tolerance receptor-like cytoplasmic kinase 1 [Lolium perenne]|uniref:salt tolerance receptor-like cytoplasmic kinase 1 n=1 Tax=Lolium perenne TaxID=4522 RepID=UPI003A99FC4F
MEIIEGIWSPPLHGTTIDQADADRRRRRRETAPPRLSQLRKSAAAATPPGLAAKLYLIAGGITEKHYLFRNVVCSGKLNLAIQSILYHILEQSDLSASNVLLDDVGGARLCDLGSACEATFSAAVAPARRGAAAAVGSPGYADPFFLRTGIVSKKSDVYSFGVLLLEVITGSPAAGTSEGGGEYLTARVLPRVRATGVAGLVDSRLGDCYDTIEASDIAGIALECVSSQPGLRPTMAQVRAAVAEKAARSIARDGSDHKLLDLFRATS